MAWQGLDVPVSENPITSGSCNTVDLYVIFVRSSRWGGSFLNNEGGWAFYSSSSIHSFRFLKEVNYDETKSARWVVKEGGKRTFTRRGDAVMEKGGNNCLKF